MEILKDLENMLETLADRYNELKKERNTLKSQYDELFNEYEKLNNEKEELNRQLEEVKRKNEEVENYLNQLKTTLISRIGEDFLNPNYDSSFETNNPVQGENSNGSYWFIDLFWRIDSNEKL